MDRSFDLSGKVALVPGGTGGLGKVICRGLAKAGADLVIGARNTAQLAKVAEDIHDFGGSAVTIEVDVANQESARAFVDKALQEMNKIDVLVNCAGMTLKKPIVELSLEDWYRVMDVNLTGVFLCSQLVAPIMKDSGGGKIINFCSMGSFVGIRTSAAYCAAKGGLLQLTKVMALEWAPWNIQVNAVAPGFFSTPLANGIKNNPESYHKLMVKSPMDRMGHPEELVGTIVYLASSASYFVTGVCIPVDGGFLADGI